MNHTFRTRGKHIRTVQEHRSGRKVKIGSKKRWGLLAMVLSIILGCLSSAAVAGDRSDPGKTTKGSYYEDAKRGYYWYEKTP